jgi:phosphoglycerate kinase
MVGNNIEDTATIKKKGEIDDNDMILDIGSLTIEKIKILINSSKTILWNGPAGYFENKNFAKGSFEIAKEISKKTKEGKLFSVIGGGDTVAVINKLNLFYSFNFVSTAGGAFLEFLEGKELPGIKALK